MVAIEKFDILSNISSTRKVKNHGHGYGVRNDLSWLSLDNYNLIQPMNSCLSTLHGRANSFDPMTNGFNFGRDFVFKSLSDTIRRSDDLEVATIVDYQRNRLTLKNWHWVSQRWIRLGHGAGWVLVEGYVRVGAAENGECP